MQKHKKLKSYVSLIYLYPVQRKRRREFNVSKITQPRDNLVQWFLTGVGPPLEVILVPLWGGNLERGVRESKNKNGSNVV